MKTIWTKPAPKNKKYVTRDELPGLIREAIAGIILGGPPQPSIDPGIVRDISPPKRPMKFMVDRLEHDRTPPAGSIGALRPSNKLKPFKCASGHVRRVPKKCPACRATPTRE